MDIDAEKQIEYWRKGSAIDWATAARWMEHGHDLHWALFIMHLSVEKALKAVYAKANRKVPPKTHNLIYLARESGMKPTEEQEDLMDEANQFNLEGRYPEYRTQLHELATLEFTRAYAIRLGGLREWALNQL